MDDLISRQAAIDAMEQAKKQYIDRRVIIGKMQDIVNNLPSAQTEPQKGKWEEKSTFDVDENGDSIIKEWQSAKCSVCGRYHTTPYMYYFDDYNYCPNCGADMRGEEE